MPAGVWAIVVLIVVIEVGGVAVFTAFVGRELAAVLGSLALLGAGALWALSVAAGRSRSGVVVLMVGWPIATVLVARLAGAGTAWPAWFVSTMVAEALLALTLRGLRLSAAAALADQTVERTVTSHG